MEDESEVIGEEQEAPLEDGGALEDPDGTLGMVGDEDPEGELGNTAELDFIAPAAQEEAPEDDPGEDESDLGLMLLAAGAGIVVAFAIVAALVFSGLGARLLMGFLAQEPEAGQQAEPEAVPEETPSQATDRPAASAPAAPISAGGNAADIADSPSSRTQEAAQAQQAPVPAYDEPGEYEYEPAPAEEDEPAQEEEPQQTWVPEQGHYEDVYETQQVVVGQQWVVDSDEWDEPVYETRESEDGTTEEVLVDTIHHEATGHDEPIYEEQQVVVDQRWVVDVPGHWE